MAMIFVQRKDEIYVQHKNTDEEYGPFDDIQPALDKYLELNSDDYAIHIYKGGREEKGKLN